LEKLTPIGSQDRFYSREKVDHVEKEIFNTTGRRATDLTEESNSRERMIIDLDGESRSDASVLRPVTNNAVTAGKRRIAADGASRPEKRRDQARKGTSDDYRENTIKSLLELLEPLPPPETVPDLLARTAKRLECQLFDKLSKERSVNPLGRSSTLLTAKPKRDIPERYQKEKERLFQKVKTYVEIATRDDVELEHVQQGEIWEVIKQILDGNS
jgi:hypothetical protein